MEGTKGGGETLLELFRLEPGRVMDAEENRRQPVRIMLVEDDEDILELLKDYCDVRGHDVSTAGDGLAARDGLFPA